MKNNNQKMTAAERAEMDARIRALRTEANALARALKKDEATEEVAEAPVKAEVAEEVTEIPTKEAEVAEEVTETPTEEVEVTEEVTEVPTEEAEVAEEVTEVPTEEAEVTEEVTEVPTEEAEVAEEVTDVPEEEAEVAEEVTDVPEEEAEVTEEVTEVPVEEAEVTEEVTETPEEEVEAPVVVAETPVEEAEVAEEATQTPAEETDKDRKSILVGILVGALVACAIVICILAAVIAKRDQTDVPAGVPEDTTPGIEDTTDPSENDPDAPAFDVNQFVNSVVNIAGELTDDENIAANANIFVGNIGEDKLVELIEKYGELNVQKAIAEMLAFVPEIKMHQYVANNGLDYNPNAVEDYDAKLLAADEAYRAATNKNPDGAVMSLEGYDTHKANREAIKALIIESGDTALLTWYEAKTDGYDLMKNQIRDTEAAEAYKEEVKLELANSKGAIELLELQLEKEASGELTVMDNVSMQYTADYNQFILNNYMYVVAN